MFIITYWGGPRDGERLQLNDKPKEEVLCGEGDISTEIDPKEFYAELASNPMRTRKYHRYMLQDKESKNKNSKNEEFVYKFTGMV